MANFNLPDDKVNSLLNMAGQKLGKDPGELRDQLQSGNMDALMNNLDPKSAAQIKSLLSNPKALELLMKNEQLRKLLGGLGNK